MAGASLVAVGTAAMQQPRLPERLVADLGRWCTEKGITSLIELRGSLQWEN
jgi:dihydroorotate dehydrogenase (NAD+) catalytic subunit